MLKKASLILFPLSLFLCNLTFSQAHVKTFSVDSSAFPNPERGFFTSVNFIADTNFKRVSDGGNTLSRPYIRLDAYRGSPLPPTFLDQITAGFQKARYAGIKIVVRFSYNHGPKPDAPLAQIQEHLYQLAPILSANEDAIFAMEGGFIGAWGEWHSSTNHLDTDYSAKGAVLSSLLAALPKSRFLALRYPVDNWVLNGNPIAPSEAFTRSNHARVGSHNDCFLGSQTDRGTWGRTGLHTVEEDKNYVAANSTYSVSGGETCALNPPRTDCPSALSELKRFHYTYLNLEYHPDVIAAWKTQGCFNEINKRLGYRLEINQATYNATAKIGTPYQLRLDITNTGFASPMNQRPVFVVFASKNASFPLLTHEDPQRWQAGQSKAVVLQVTLPQKMKTGTYNIYLWLPDRSSRLSADPSYAVRFANLNTWDSKTGYNLVVSGITVTN